MGYVKGFSIDFDKPSLLHVLHHTQTAVRWTCLPFRTTSTMVSIGRHLLDTYTHPRTLCNDYRKQENVPFIPTPRPANAAPWHSRTATPRHANVDLVNCSVILQLLTAGTQSIASPRLCKPTSPNPQAQADRKSRLALSEPVKRFTAPAAYPVQRCQDAVCIMSYSLDWHMTTANTSLQDDAKIIMAISENASPAT